MSDYRSEASSRSAVKTELTSAHLECLLISLASGLFVAAVWMQTTGAVLLRVKRYGFASPGESAIGRLSGQGGVPVPLGVQH